MLEVLLEQGLAGFIALMIFLIVTLRKSWRLGRMQSDDGAVGSLVFALVVFAVVAAMFSGDIGANGGVFLWAGVTAGLVARVRATSRSDPADGLPEMRTALAPSAGPMGRSPAPGR